LACARFNPSKLKDTIAFGSPGYARLNSMAGADDGAL